MDATMTDRLGESVRAPALDGAMTGLRYMREVAAARGSASLSAAAFAKDNCCLLAVRLCEYRQSTG